LGNNFHADIIVDDILFSGQFYPDATAATVAQLETANDRMMFIHLSGNEQNGGYWQGPFVFAAATVAGSQAMLLDFGIASGGASDAFNAITVRATDRLRLILNWNDPPHDHHQQSILRDFRRRAVDCRRRSAARERGIQSRPGTQGAAQHRDAIGSGRLGPELRFRTCRRGRGSAFGRQLDTGHCDFARLAWLSEIGSVGM
jgi:hypothetical protein